MGHTTGKIANGFQFLGLPQLVFQILFIRNVNVVFYDLGDIPGTVKKG